MNKSRESAWISLKPPHMTAVSDRCYAQLLYYLELDILSSIFELDELCCLGPY